MGAGGTDPFDAEGTIGIEEEFFLVDESGRPLGGTDELCYDHDPPPILEDRLDHELFTFVIETQTPVIDGLERAPSSLGRVREALVDYAAEHGYRVASAGLHPTAHWRELEHVSKPRYRRQLDRIQYPQHRNTTAGLHVHVGVDDGDRAVWIANELRWYLPVVLAVSANSPFWCGFDTGLASARACIFENLPNTGMPPAYDGLAEYTDLEATLLETGSINDRGEIWFDVRPHTEYGTVEVRTPDAQSEPWRVLAITEYVVRLVERLGAAHRQLAAGAEPAEVWADAHAPWADPTDATRPAADRLELLVENKWRATRYGRDATLITRAGTGTVDVMAAAAAEVDRLGLDRFGDLVAAEGGSSRLRRILREEGVAGCHEAIRLDGG